MVYDSGIPEIGCFYACSSPMIRGLELIFSKFLHFSCPISATDSALLYRRQVLLEKNDD
jgi:hypothetical protein